MSSQQPDESDTVINILILQMRRTYLIDSLTSCQDLSPSCLVAEILLLLVPLRKSQAVISCTEESAQKLWTWDPLPALALNF